MKLAIVHDHLNQVGGAEKVLHVLHTMWPSAPIFTLLHDKRRMGTFLADADIRPSFLQHIPGSHRFFTWLLPLMPTATEAHDLSEFDIVISSSSAFAKGVITKPGARHICYCHTPTRYLWSDRHSYVEELRQPRIIKKLLPPVLSLLRLWDKTAADRVHTFVANSRAVADRIKTYYGRESEVIYPPVDLTRFSISSAPKTYYLAGGRLVAYKRFDLVVDAFTKLHLPLVIFGTGPVEQDLRRRAGETVRFVGRVSDHEQARLYQNAIAYIHPQEEDFGITAVESMASGRPVIAFRRGGIIESVEEGVTGTFFDIQDWERLASVILAFDPSAYDPKIIRQQAERFSTEAFITRLRTLVEQQKV